MRRRLAVFLVLLATVLLPATASGSPPPAAPPTPPPASGPPSVQDFGNTGGVLGAPDLFAQEDVNCRHLAGATAEVIANCTSDGEPRSAYPATNYGLDVHVDTGLTSPAGDVTSIFQTFISAIFQGLATIVGAILSILGFAFSFDLFRDGYVPITHALHAAVGSFTNVLLPLSMTIFGVVLIKLLAFRQEGKMISHTLVTVLLIGLALAVAANPAGSIGFLDVGSNQAAGTAVGMFSGSAGGGGYADSEPALWRTAIETPWCVAEFGNETWCNERPDAAMRAARADIIANHLPQALGDQAIVPQEAIQQEPLEKARLLDAHTNGEMFLSFVTNANARNGKNSPWTLYSVLAKEHPALLAIRGGGGFITRGIDLFFGSFVGVLFLLLILFIAVQIVVNSFVIVACLLVLPVMILVPVTEGGQSAFMKWVGWLFLAFARKIIYALFLGLIVVVVAVVGQIASSWGTVVYWFLLSVTFGTALHLRHHPMMLIGMKSHPTPVGYGVDKYKQHREHLRERRDRHEAAEYRLQARNYYGQNNNGNGHDRPAPREDVGADEGGPT